MHGSRKFYQRGSHFDKLFFYIELLASSERVHINCELPDEIYNICECLFRLDTDVQARCPIDICD